MARAMVSVESNLTLQAHVPTLTYIHTTQTAITRRCHSAGIWRTKCSGCGRVMDREHAHSAGWHGPGGCPAQYAPAALLLAQGPPCREPLHVAMSFLVRPISNMLLTLPAGRQHSWAHSNRKRLRSPGSVAHMHLQTKACGRKVLRRHPARGIRTDLPRTQRRACP